MQQRFKFFADLISYFCYIPFLQNLFNFNIAQLFQQAKMIYIFLLWFYEKDTCTDITSFTADYKLSITHRYKRISIVGLYLETLKNPLRAFSYQEKRFYFLLFFFKLFTQVKEIECTEFLELCFIQSFTLFSYIYICIYIHIYIVGN